ncbi:GYF domain-containing protein [Sorangium sp. So ce1000]|uniref:GYF domain-containing protein n=1 Tax=Sorangium sp. So ce1000 TaxID=3133325 RepID=UPI003F614B8F
MKFICDNCKAKYQIGDEKVAGKMVRMQCRRCGHLIQVSASVTESSVAQALPVEPPRAAGDDAHLAPPSDEAPAADAGAASPLKPPPASSLGQGAAPAPPRPAPQALPRPGIAPRPPVAPRAAPASGPRPAAAPQAPPATRAVQPPAPVAPARSPAPAARAAEPAPPAGAAGVFTRSMSNDRPLGKAPAVRATSSEDWYVGVGGVPLGPVRLSVIRDKALAGAVDGESLVWREGFDEWQPLKNFPELIEIVTQAQSTRLAPPARRISTTSLSVGQPQTSPSAKAPSSTRGPALAAAAPARSATHEPAPPGLNEPPAAVAAFTAAGVPTASTPLPAPVASSGASVASASSVGSGAAAARVAPVAPASAPAAWPGAPAGAVRTHAAGAAPVEVLADPFAADRTAPVAFAAGPELASPASTELAHGAGGLTAGGAPSAAAPAGGLAVGPVRSATAPSGGRPTAAGSPMASAAALSAAEPAPLVATPASLVETVAPRRRSGMSPLAYAFIAMAAAFGGVSAFVLLSPKPQPQPVQIVTAPQSQQPADLPTAAPPPPPSVAPDVPAPAETASARPDVASTVKPGGVASQRPPPEKPVAPSGSAQFDRSGFGAGVPGPASGPGSQGAGSGLSQLSQGEISGVVEANRPSVRRHCWQPALDARASNASTTARVSASVVIGASGAVQSVSAGGSEKDYPGLSSCIASRIKSWRFPPSSGSTPVTIPFVFAAQ